MSKKNKHRWDWLSSITSSDQEDDSSSDDYEEEEEEIDENDESYGADDYISSRPWGIDNDGY